MIPEHSSYGDWPSRANPDAHYKFVGFWTELSQSLITTERKTYSILEWVGDVGGLYDGLLVIGSNLIAPITTLILRFALIANMRPTNTENDNSSASLLSIVGICCNSKKSAR